MPSSEEIFIKIKNGVDLILNTHNLYNMFSDILWPSQSWIPQEVIGDLKNGLGGYASVCRDNQREFYYVFAEKSIRGSDFKCVFTDDPAYKNDNWLAIGKTQKEVDECMQAVFSSLQETLKDQMLRYLNLD
ncbi:MAG: hypothetical protein J6Y02_18025 [Pseudobutyrivibrio sp.]|nr:hypothetical protein [Pseudobutyrivibrio sp.]